MTVLYVMINVYFRMKVIVVEKDEPIEQEIDLTKIYNYKDFPDKVSGRCDNCGNTIFKSSVKDFVFLRECRQCGMKKSI
jgi:uncharacterized protein with PIN domain